MKSTRLIGEGGGRVVIPKILKAGVDEQYRHRRLSDAPNRRDAAKFECDTMQSTEQLLQAIRGRIPCATTEKLCSRLDHAAGRMHTPVVGLKLVTNVARRVEYRKPHTWSSMIVGRMCCAARHRLEDQQLQSSVVRGRLGEDTSKANRKCESRGMVAF